MLLILDQLYSRNSNRGARRHFPSRFFRLIYYLFNRKLCTNRLSDSFRFSACTPIQAISGFQWNDHMGLANCWEFQLDRRLIGRRLRGHAPVFRRPRRRGCGTGHTHWIPAMMILVAMSLVVTPPNARWKRAFNDANSCEQPSLLTTANFYFRSSVSLPLCVCGTQESKSTLSKASLK